VRLRNSAHGFQLTAGVLESQFAANQRLHILGLALSIKCGISSRSPSQEAGVVASPYDIRHDFAEQHVLQAHDASRITELVVILE
jgi:hypothetical protein